MENTNGRDLLDGVFLNLFYESNLALPVDCRKGLRDSRKTLAGCQVAGTIRIIINPNICFVTGTLILSEMCCPCHGALDGRF